MRKAKHATRRQDTRRRLELGEAVEAAGAGHLTGDEIIEILSAHVGGRSETDRKRVDQHANERRQGAAREQVS